jgi:hypothetical protein
MIRVAEFENGGDEGVALQLDHGVLKDGEYTEGGGTMDEDPPAPPGYGVMGGEDFDDVGPDLPAPSVQRNIDMATLVHGWREKYAGMPDVLNPDWPLRKGRISASALATFARCPELFRQQQIVGVKRTSSGASIAGSSVHGMAEANWRWKMAQGEDLPEREATLILDAVFDSQIQEALRVAPPDWGAARGRPLDEDAHRDRAKVAGLSYLKNAAPGVQPVEAEARFAVMVEGCPVPVVGFIDLVTAEAMVDLKVQGQTKKEIDPGWRIQGLTYLLARDLPMTWHSVSWSGNMILPDEAEAHLTMARTLDTYNTARQLLRTYTTAIVAYAERFGPDEPWPDALTHPWACNYCDLRAEICPWWHGGGETLTPREGTLL